MLLILGDLRLDDTDMTKPILFTDFYIPLERFENQPRSPLLYCERGLPDRAAYQMLHIIYTVQSTVVNPLLPTWQLHHCV